MADRVAAAPAAVPQPASGAELMNECALRFAADESSRASNASALAVVGLAVAYSVPVLVYGGLRFRLAPAAGMMLSIAGMLLSMTAMLFALAAGSLGSAAAFATLPLAAQGVYLLAKAAAAAHQRERCMTAQSAVALCAGVVLIGGGLALVVLADDSRFICVSEKTLLAQMQTTGFLVAVAVTVAVLALSWFTVRCSEQRLLAVPVSRTGLATSDASAQNATPLNEHPTTATVRTPVTDAAAGARQPDNPVASLGHAAVSLIEAMKSVEPHLHSGHPLAHPGCDAGVTGVGSLRPDLAAADHRLTRTVSRPPRQQSDCVAEGLEVGIGAAAASGQQPGAACSVSPLQLSAASAAPLVQHSHSRGPSDSLSVPARAALASLPATTRPAVPASVSRWPFGRKSGVAAQTVPAATGSLPVMPTSPQMIGPWAPASTSRQPSAVVLTGRPSRQPQVGGNGAATCSRRLSSCIWSILGSCASGAWRGPWYLALTATAAPLYIGAAGPRRLVSLDDGSSGAGRAGKTSEQLADLDVATSDHDDAQIIAGRELLRALPSDKAVRHFLELVEAALQKEAAAAVVTSAAAGCAVDAGRQSDVSAEGLATARQAHEPETAYSNVGAGTGLCLLQVEQRARVPDATAIAVADRDANGPAREDALKVEADADSHASVEAAVTALHQFAAAAKEASVAVQALGLSTDAAGAESRQLVLEPAALPLATIPEEPEQQHVIGDSATDASLRHMSSAIEDAAKAADMDAATGRSSSCAIAPTNVPRSAALSLPSSCALPHPSRRRATASGWLELHAAYSLQAEARAQAHAGQLEAAVPAAPLSAPARAESASGSTARSKRLPAAVSDDIISGGIGYAEYSEYPMTADDAAKVTEPALQRPSGSGLGAPAKIEAAAQHHLSSANEMTTGSLLSTAELALEHVTDAPAVATNESHVHVRVHTPHTHERAAAGASDATVAADAESSHQHRHSRAATLAASSVAAVRGGVNRALYRLRLEAAQREATKLLAAAALDEPPRAYAQSGYARAHPLAYSCAAAAAGVLTLLACKVVAEELKTAVYATTSEHAGSTSGQLGGDLAGGPLLWCSAALSMLCFWLHQRALANAHRLFDPLYVLPLYLALLLAGCVATGNLLTGDFAAMTPQQAGMLTAAEALLVLGALVLVDNAAAAIVEEQERRLAQNAQQLQLQLQQEEHAPQSLQPAGKVVGKESQAEAAQRMAVQATGAQPRRNSVVDNENATSTIECDGGLAVDTGSPASAGRADGNVDSQLAKSKASKPSTSASFKQERVSALDVFRPGTSGSHFLRRYWRSSSSGFGCATSI